MRRGNREEGVNSILDTGEGIGASVMRKEDWRHLRGRGCFTSDIRMEGVQEVAFVRSPVAHATIAGRTKPAGHEASVFFNEDLTGVKPITTPVSVAGFKHSDYPVLASGKVRFVGEAVAMCIASTRAEAEDLAEAVMVDYLELPAVASVAAAMRPDAAQPHDSWADNVFMELCGDTGIEAVVNEAAVTVELELELARQTIHPMEGRAILSWWDFRAGQLVIHMSTQVPHPMRTGLAEFLGVPQAMIRVAPVDIGGAFGYKLQLQPEEIAVAWLALTYKRPFRWVEDRREHLIAGANTRQAQYRIKGYASASGRLLAIDAEVAIDIGAYSVWPFTAALEPFSVRSNLPGPYDLKAYRHHIRAVATNKPGFCPYRGVGRPGTCFAIEAVIDAIAMKIGREPWEVRAESLVRAEAMPYTDVTGKLFDIGDYPASLETARTMIGFDAFRAETRLDGFRDPEGRYLGIGFATYYEQTANGTSFYAPWDMPMVPGYDQAQVKLTADGALEVKSGLLSFGQGLETTLAQVANSMTGVPLCNIMVTLGDTATTPYSTGAYASRAIVMGGGAVSRAAAVVADRIRAIAGHLLQVAPADIVFEGGRICAGNASLGYADVGNAWYLRPDLLPAEVHSGGLEATEAYKPPVDSGIFSYGTHAAKVAVDVRTGHVEILDYVISDDCGTMVNPMIVEGQTFGGAAQGIGTALFEESPYDENGQPLASTLIDYLLPGPVELPRFRLHHVQTPSPFSEHGIKGAGEGGCIPPGAVITNAINDALRPLGAVIRALPASPERILAAIAVAEKPETGA